MMSCTSYRRALWRTAAGCEGKYILLECSRKRTLLTFVIIWFGLVSCVGLLLLPVLLLQLLTSHEPSGTTSSVCLMSHVSCG